MWEGATAFVAVDNRRDQPAISKAVWRKKLSINQTAMDCFIHSDSLKKNEILLSLSNSRRKN